MYDLSIGSPTWPEHLASIEDVFQTLVKNTLSANPRSLSGVFKSSISGIFNRCRWYSNGS